MKAFCLIFFGLLSIVQSYKILVIFPAPAVSHFALGNALAKGLANAGHEITMLSPYKDKNPPKNYKDVVLTGFVEVAQNQLKVNHFDVERTHPWINIYSMNMIGNLIVNDTLNHPNFKQLLKEKFDLIILEQFKMDAMKALGCHFQAPVIMFSTIGAHTWVNGDVANPSPPSYVPDLFVSYSSNMNLWERTFNSLTILFHTLNNHLVFYPSQKEFVRKHLPQCVDNYNNVSLYLINSHESTNGPAPKVPNIINIGGFHIDPPKQLPKDLKDYMDNAKDGVVYFSMGSQIKCSEMKPEIKETLIKVLGKLKQKVLWKYDGDTLPGKPDNVRLGKWFPQADILAHPNIKLFITHGGLLSTQETVYHGVPVLTLPVFGDQKLNAARTEALGYGLKLLFSEINEKDLTDTLDKLINDPRYRQNAKFRSTISHDRPVKPMDEIIYWTEYVARYKGASHLMVAGINLPWYQYLLLDVILLVALVIAVTFIIIYLTCKKLCCSRKDKKKRD